MNKKEISQILLIISIALMVYCIGLIIYEYIRAIVDFFENKERLVYFGVTKKDSNETAITAKGKLDKLKQDTSMTSCLYYDYDTPIELEIKSIVNSGEYQNKTIDEIETLKTITLRSSTPNNKPPIKL